MAGGARGQLHGHLHRSHGALLHGGPPQQQAETGAGVGGTVCLRGRTKRYQHIFQGILLSISLDV